MPLSLLAKNLPKDLMAYWSLLGLVRRHGVRARGGAFRPLFFANRKVGLRRRMLQETDPFR